MAAVREYVDPRGRSLFRDWFDELDVAAATKVSVAVERLQLGHHSAVKGVGAGVLEYRIHFGPGYRIYFGRDGDEVILLLCGGTKKRQDEDIADARRAWSEYKERKKLETGKESERKGRG